MENQIKKLRCQSAQEHDLFVVEILKAPQDHQLWKLENSYLSEIDEEEMSEQNWKRLAQAIRDERITFFVARCGERTVGMCSVSRCFSTFSCADTAVFEDFYVEPAFRRKGIARMLAKAAQDWCRENGVASLTVCCASCDEGMYKALGFDMRLGSTYAHLI